jgi:hypothetical protein
MIPSWARSFLARLILLVVACVAILGGAWALSGNSGQQGIAQDQAPKQGPATTPDAAPTEPAWVAEKKQPETARVPEEVKKPSPAATEPGRPSRNTKSPKLLEVDLSKLPPDLVKEIKGAIVEKGSPAKDQPAPRQAGEKKRPVNP